MPNISPQALAIAGSDNGATARPKEEDFCAKF